jgi:hypothetical protein
MIASMAAALADAIVAFHLCIVSFCVVGELAIIAGALLKWRWIRNPIFRVAHLGLVLYVAGEAMLGIPCPLTEWEYRLRMAAGQLHDRNIPFVGRLIRSVIFYDFPAWVFVAIYVGFGALVLATLILVRPRRTRP